MSASARRGPRARIYPYLTAEIRERLSAYCAARATTESAVVDAALRQYLDGMSETALLLRRLDRLGQAQARTQRDLAIHSEAFALFVKIWFAHTPTVPAEGRKAAQTVAETRYRQFVQYVAHQLSAGRRFVDDLPATALGDDAEASPPPAATAAPAAEPA
jgi:hypothetical protein